MTNTKNHFNTHGYHTPKRQPPSVTHSPPGYVLDAYFKLLTRTHFSTTSGVGLPSIVSGRLAQTNESEGLGEKEAEPYSRPAHFLSWVEGNGDIVHRPDYTPNHQRNQLGTLHHRIVGISMVNGIRHDPCIPRHWAMGCPAWTLAEPSHNKVYVSDQTLMLPASAMCCI